MKKFVRKNLVKSLASACFVGTSCCTTMLIGQQAPNYDALPPVVSAQSGQNALPPIVSSQQSLPPIASGHSVLPPVIRASQSSLPPIVSSANRTNDAMPRPVSVQGMIRGANNTAQSMNGQAMTPPKQIVSTVRQGQNFPTDAQARIAQFIQANGNSVPPSPSNGVNYATPQSFMNARMQEEASPSDLPMQPVPVPNSLPLPQSNIPSLASPQSGGNTMQLVQPGDMYDGIVMPSSPGLSMERQPMQSRNVGPTQGVAPGSSDFFHQGEIDSYADTQVDYGEASSTFDCCGFICDARNYFVVDALYWEREDGVFRASNMDFIDDLDHSFGGRITWGSRRDFSRGREFSYMQLDPLLSVSNQFDAGGTLLGAIFGSAGGFADSTFSAFRNSTFIEQFHKTDLLGGEMNRTYWGSDVAKAFIGARFIHFDDEFHMSSANTMGQQGIYTIDTTNNLFGMHVGGELLYDIGYRLSYSVHGKLGGYLNFFDGRTGLLNNGTQYIANSDEDTDFSYSAEIGATVRFKLSPNVRLRAGYDMMALLDIRDVESSFSTVVTPQTGTFYNDGDALFHGASFGIEIYR